MAARPGRLASTRHGRGVGSSYVPDPRWDARAMELPSKESKSDIGHNVALVVRQPDGTRNSDAKPELPPGPAPPGLSLRRSLQCYSSPTFSPPSSKSRPIAYFWQKTKKRRKFHCGDILLWLK